MKRLNEIKKKNLQVFRLVENPKRVLIAESARYVSQRRRVRSDTENERRSRGPRGAGARQSGRRLANRQLIFEMRRRGVPDGDAPDERGRRPGVRFRNR